MEKKIQFNIRPIELDDENDRVIIIDQSELPNNIIYLEIKSASELYDAIKKLKVRGAPLIGITAAFGIYIELKKINDHNDFYNQFLKLKNYIATSRPTAVNLSWALERIDNCIKTNLSVSLPEIKNIIKKEVELIYDEDVEMCKKIGEYGLTLLKQNWGILTHCNAGCLATSKYGTALAPIYLGQSKGYEFKVFADETRPLLQGARLTAWELQKSGVDITLICDNMASTLMQNGKIQAILVGCDRIASNGDTANKIGTSGLAVMADYYKIPFYICGPTSTIDMKCTTGKDIIIEERDENEITQLWYSKPMAPKNIKCFNPSFDITDNSLITAIITDMGIAYPPFSESLKSIIRKK